jgi:predicted ATPase
VSAAYRELCSLLSRELNARPSPETVLLVERIRRRAPPAGPVAAAPAEPPGWVPRPLTSLIDRGAEVEAVRERVAAARLVTLTGAGGVGKTRLAIQIAEQATAAFPDGAWFIELAPLAQGGRIAATIAARARLAEAAGSVEEQVVDWLRPRRALLVLDNAEHLLGECARLAERLLRECPRLQVVVTSRDPLGTPGEVVWRVPPLAVPPAAAVAQTDLASWDAVRLFVERATAARRGFRLAPENAAAVAEICRRLDGLPLAIELAAARVSALTPTEIALRLDDRFTLLAAARRDVVPHHRTLAAALDWSYDLLKPVERSLLGLLSVFPTDFSLEAAAAVSGAAEVIAPLTRLVDHSLVLHEDSAPAGRYRLIETIRCYAAGKLAPAAKEEARRRHLEHYLALAERLLPRTHGPEQPRALADFEREREQFLTALTWGVARPDTAETALRLAATLRRFWWMRGYSSEGLERLERCLAAAPGAPAPLRARALAGAGMLANRQHHTARARALLDEALALAEACGEARAAAAAHNALGLLAGRQGEARAAIRHLEEALRRFRALGEDHGAAAALENLAVQHRHLGDHARAGLLFEEAHAMFERLGDPHGIADALMGLGVSAMLAGDLSAARARLEECLARHEELGTRVGSAFALGALARLALCEGRPAEAARLAGAAAALRDGVRFSLPHYARIDDQRMDEALRATLGEAALQAERERGRGMTPRELLERRDGAGGGRHDAGATGD